MEVLAGAHDITIKESSQVRLNASSFHIHEDYDWSYENNLVIIKLWEPLEFNEFISPIEINWNPGELLGNYYSIIST